ncbi:hypothetical protein ACIQI7_32460 [Kitasatospora sp. NPDC092039]|uniref:hypothetical protein n=1 Tax=Kitasatospora sp. NPDC092039 TaxID=3364086 RepID=UPI0038106D79
MWIPTPADVLVSDRILQRQREDGGLDLTARQIQSGWQTVRSRRPPHDDMALADTLAVAVGVLLRSDESPYVVGRIRQDTAGLLSDITHAGLGRR